MDLNRLYNLTTPELRTEAERLGVRDTYAMSRGQLIHAIRSRAGESQPEGLLGKVLGFAKWAIQTTAAVAPRPEDEEATRFKRPSEVPVPSVPPEPASGTWTAPETASGTAPASETASAPQTASGTASAPETASGTAPASETASAPQTASGTAPASETASAPASAFGSEENEEVAGPSGSSSRPPAGVFSRGASSFEEPFPTRTMARILAEQGHFKRALAIYAKLLGEEPEDRELSVEAEEVRARSRARRTELQ
ncbi:MAG: hypothetical protein WAU39_18660 [Polyangiales bacterium]